jgi:hypothetical protein
VDKITTFFNFMANWLAIFEFFMLIGIRLNIFGTKKPYDFVKHVVCGRGSKNVSCILKFIFV